ncbi:hypothetical protein EBB79_04045 [Parasedimentitalea marina]|uniref:Uncharacterized protein n=1 Tax=Parasedimentitalea marina TaxID=2483033 RepID=A0A3T0MZF2_9RHOB|nr:hypothetical protein EBB79_04045 [Parasedimentitalea marina]
MRLRKIRDVDQPQPARLRTPAFQILAFQTWLLLLRWLRVLYANLLFGRGVDDEGSVEAPI